VVFFGEVPMSEVWSYIERSAVCVSPIFPTYVLNQGSPTKLIEYMAMARPVVANDENPEQRQVLNESTAGFGRPWDEEAFAAAIVTLLSDPDLARKMGADGREWVRNHRTSAVMADVVEETYKAVLNRGA
jgi:glycosyltransferase involved in cell wall biosynthesis